MAGMMRKNTTRTPIGANPASTITSYKSGTIYEDQTGFFVIKKGERLWFDTIAQAKDATKYTRLFTLYSNVRRSGTESKLL